MSRNPFGSEAVPRNLDNEHIFSQWFRVADNGSSHASTPDLNILYCCLACVQDALQFRARFICKLSGLSCECELLAKAPVRFPNIPFWLPLNNKLLLADSDGRLTGADAVRFFERSGLPRDLLAKVWAWILMASSLHNCESHNAGFMVLTTRPPTICTGMEFGRQQQTRLPGCQGL